MKKYIIILSLFISGCSISSPLAYFDFFDNEDNFTLYDNQNDFIQNSDNVKWYTLDNQILRVFYSKVLGEFSGYSLDGKWVGDTSSKHMSSLIGKVS